MSSSAAASSAASETPSYPRMVLDVALNFFASASFAAGSARALFGNASTVVTNAATTSIGALSNAAGGPLIDKSKEAVNDVVSHVGAEVKAILQRSTGAVILVTATCAATTGCCCGCSCTTCLIAAVGGATFFNPTGTEKFVVHVSDKVFNAISGPVPAAIAMTAVSEAKEKKV